MMHNAASARRRWSSTPASRRAGALLQEPHLSGPLVDMARPICKWAAQVEHAHDVPRALRRAFKIAAEPPQGPVFLALPMDVLDEEADVDIEPTTYTNWRGRADAAGLAEVAELLLAAERPMLMVGDRVALADAQAEVDRAGRAARRADLRVLRLRVQRAGLPPAEPGQRRLRHARTARADARRLRRAVRGRRAGVPDDLPEAEEPPAAPARSWSRSTSTLGARQERPRRPRAAGRSQGGLAELAERCARPGRPSRRASPRSARPQSAERTRRPASAYWSSARKNWDAAPITAPRLMHEIQQALPDNALVFSEA